MSLTKALGFRNLGNTCYMNSTLQALLSSTTLNSAIIMCLRKNPKCLNNLSPMMMEYCRMLIDQVTVESNIYSPLHLKKILDTVNPSFRGSAQHDSHEFLIYMINDFVDEKKDKTMTQLINKVCFGKCKEYLCCTECHQVSEKYSNFLDVLLPIPNMTNPDLIDCFKYFSKFDTLDADNKWKCSKCNKHVIAQKRTEIYEVPEVAIFTLKRFKGRYAEVKDSTPVRIYPYIELQNKKLQLIATINHYGNTAGGHYVAYVSREKKETHDSRYNNTNELNKKNKDWYRADDESITPVSIESILNDPSVYIVIYQGIK